MVKGEYQTQRLLLRLSSPGLAQAVAAYFIRNRAFLEGLEPAREPGFYTAAHQAAELEKDAANSRAEKSHRFWLFKKDAPNTVIGMVGLNEIILGAFQSCFLGYRLDFAETGKGYATEAVAKCAEIAFQDAGLHRIEANIMPRNAPSLRVVEKLGFRNEGLAQRYLQINGVWEDHIHMVLLNDLPENQTKQ